MPFGGGDMTVTYRLTNSGNVIVTGAARIQVKGPLGVRVANSDQIEIPELLPDSEIRLTERLSGVFPAGRLTAEVAVNPKMVEGTLLPRSQTRTVWAVPWLVLAGLGLVLLLLFLWWLRRWRARRYAALDRPDELGPTGGAVPVAAGTGRVPGVMLVALAATALAAPAASAPAPPPVPAPDPASVEVQVSIAPAQPPAPTASPTLSPTGAPTSPAPSPPPTPPGGKLPRTGVAIGVILVAGAALVGGGTGLRLLVGRRKSP